MVLDIHWTLTVNVPQLTTLEETLRLIGEQLVDAIQAIKDEVARLSAAQAQGSQAIADQLTAILAEMQQYSAGEITDDQYNNLLAALKTAADQAEQQAADIKANTAQLTQIVPDEPPPA